MIPSSQPPKRSLPEPFSRPKIEISEVKREWAWIWPNTLQKDDVVPDIGLITEVDYKENHDYVSVTGPNGIKYLEVDKMIWAFRKKSI